MKTKKLLIPHAVARLVEGKLEDRASGTTPMTGDVYSKMVEAGVGRFAAAYIDVSRADCLELAEEMSYALDGLRELTIGERSSANAMLKRCRAYAGELA
jgi:hypothetical protein